MSEKAPEQFWAGGNSRRIAKRIIIEGDLVLQTPASFGRGGGDETTDMPLLVDPSDGRTPLLSGATLAGALRAYLRAVESGYRAAPPQGKEEFAAGRNTLTYALFGAFKGDDNGEQSKLICEDAYSRDFALELRDGVKIDPKSRTAEDKGLFDMQVWKPGTTFPLRFELLIIEPKKIKKEEKAAYAKRFQEAEAEVKKAFLAAAGGLDNGAITLGARKHRGFGRVSVAGWRAREYDLHDLDGLQEWLERGASELAGPAVANLADLPVFKELAEVPDRRAGVEIDAYFELDGSLLIRSAGYQNPSPDMVHLHSYNPQSAKMEPVLPGTSIAGALRARAGRILRVLYPESEDAQIAAWLGDLFGSYSGEGTEHEAKQKQASLLTVEEYLVRRPAPALVQNRVAIDRFTGGAKDAALFNEQPAFALPETELRIRLRLEKPALNERDPEKKKAAQKTADRHFQAQVGLLLLLIKDLWTGDLPLGGEISVGRGRLRGKSATITYRDGKVEPQTWSFTQEGDSLLIDEATAAALEEYVTVLKKEEIV
jgi:CRISPR/Cas system CSM-associated protein Csm3 (group 7 of RAMP superfamily)